LPPLIRDVTPNNFENNGIIHNNDLSNIVISDTHTRNFLGKNMYLVGTSSKNSPWMLGECNSRSSWCFQVAQQNPTEYSTLPETKNVLKMDAFGILLSYRGGLFSGARC